jgi:hypothetical protein
MRWWQKLGTGALSKEKSLATGVVLAFIAWTLTRLVDGITAYNTLEYDVTQKPSSLADGRAGYTYQVLFTNLAGETTLKSLRATVSGSADITFSDVASDHSCAVQPPAWGRVECEAFPAGFKFTAPPLVAGTFAGMEVKYTRAAGSSDVPVLRILLAEGQDFRLVEAGLATRAVRHQTGILITFLAVATLSLLLSLVAGVREPKKDV